VSKLGLPMIAAVMGIVSSGVMRVSIHWPRSGFNIGRGERAV